MIMEKNIEKKYKYFFVSIKKNVIEFYTSQKQTHYMYNKLNFLWQNLISEIYKFGMHQLVKKNLIYNIKRGINR